MRRKRTARAGERILPTLSDEEADMIMARLSDKEADTIISTLNREEVDIVMARTHGIEGRDSRLARLEERREAFNKSLPSIHTD
jgi:flagellar motility protein MotE (MotC chaperone)